jgi:hypothetical protein
MGWCTCRTGGEANSLLSASLTAAAISNLFMLRHLGACIDEREKLRVRSGGVGQVCCCHKRKGMTALFSQAVKTGCCMLRRLQGHTQLQTSNPVPSSCSSKRSAACKWSDTAQAFSAVYLGFRTLTAGSPSHRHTLSM